MLGLLIVIHWIGIYVLQIQGGDRRRNWRNPLDSAGKFVVVGSNDGMI